MAGHRPVGPERELKAVGSVGPDAAAVAVNDADLAAAITVAEQGRGVLWGRLLELHTPLEDMRTAAPKLAARLTEIRDQLDPDWSDSSGYAVTPARLAQRENPTAWLARLSYPPRHACMARVGLIVDGLMT